MVLERKDENIVHLIRFLVHSMCEGLSGRLAERTEGSDLYPLVYAVEAETMTAAVQLRLVVLHVTEMQFLMIAKLIVQKK